jgi:hypothetical protein
MASKAVVNVTSNPTFRDLRGRFAKASKALLENLRGEMRGLGSRFVAVARTEAPRKTGKFAGSINYRTFNTGNSLGFNIYTQQPLGKFITKGTKPHIIRAKNVRFLRFYWAKGPQGAGVYFFRSVRHPGTKPNDYLDRAMNKWRPEALAGLRRVSTRWTADIIGGGK